MDFVSCLRSLLQNLHRPDVWRLRQAVERLDCTRERIAPLVTQPRPPLRYGRNVVFRSDRFEAIVIHLPSGTETPIHDHGNSIGCIRVVAGTLENKVFTLSPHHSQPALSSTGRHQAGEYVLIGHGLIHAMRNAGEEPMISFHVYTPPLENTKQYS
ncbi:cysteine dioxygenase family protein [Polycladomyces sp. WAk]|uniref:Cysteine dioxygenase family protein n=1 Tax=Polycladomyces zharkentensis TaxID=2807616 RepID=A0ABS2WLF8_9BACL|nr:cysteine dioxygenase family protein [Polycladomyces sp. WAk]MBN2910281.1 cysteine dioxygenase family protein [Polycladomyces sp. WAk]